MAATGNGSVPQTTISMLQLRAGQIVSNDYLTVLHTSNLRKAGETEERIAAVASWRSAASLSDGERIALALVEAVLTADPSGGRVGDDLYAQASQHYDYRALATLIIAELAGCVGSGAWGRPAWGRAAWGRPAWPSGWSRSGPS